MSKEYLKRFGEEDKRMADEAVRVSKTLPVAKSNDLTAVFCFFVLLAAIVLLALIRR
jgi:hypothetical protein